jgi:large subunit ribosomal protein L27Ae
VHPQAGHIAAQAREAAAEDTSKAVVIDVTKHGLSKVLGKGQLPEQPVVVRARFVSKLAERKIKEVGGVVQLVA